MKRLLTIIFLSVFLFCQTAHAEEAPYVGVWSGNIGQHKVQVCFASDSQYFYLTKKQGITLYVPEKASKNWQEWQERIRNPKTYSWETPAIWIISSIDKKILKGTWVNQTTQQSLPIALKKLAVVKQLGDSANPYFQCGDEFYKPIVQAIQYTYKQEKIGDKTLKAIKTKAGEAFEYPSNLKNADKVNAFITGWLKGQAISAYECELNGGSGYQRYIEPVFWTLDWMVIKDILPDTYCGGAHGGSDSLYLTFDLNSGKLIDTSRWLKNFEKAKSSFSNDENGQHLAIGFAKLIERSFINNDDPVQNCKDSLDFMGLRNPYPDKNGLNFYASFAHAIRQCDTVISIPYKEIAPYLTATGKKAVKSIPLTKQ